MSRFSVSVVSKLKARSKQSKLKASGDFLVIAKDGGQAIQAPVQRTHANVVPNRILTRRLNSAPHLLAALPSSLSYLFF
jgi:hypothetical protein